MGYTPQKKALKKKQPASSPMDGVRSQWAQKRPVVFFVLGFAMLMILFYVVLLSEFFQNNIQNKIMSGYANISGFILNLMGQGITPTAEKLISLNFSISIARGCDALEAMALFASALLTFPARWKHKLVGLFAGLALLYILNVIRIVSLYLTGRYYPKAFEFMHVEFWQAIFIIFAIGIWIFWIKWSRKVTPHAAQ
jgi:exosortase/archaeosortase family protein